MMRRFTILMIAVFSILPSITHAEQWAFKRIPANDETVFLYGYRNSYGEARQLSFELNNKLIAQSDSALLSVKEVRKISDTQAHEGLQELSAQSRDNIEGEYKAIYDAMQKQADAANEKLSPYYKITINRSGDTQFGIRQLEGNSAGIGYFWQIPRTGVGSKPTIDMDVVLTAIVAEKNTEFTDKLSLNLILESNNIGLEVKVASALYNQLGNDIHATVWADITKKLKKQSEAAKLSQQYVQAMTDFYNKSLPSLELAAEIELAKFQKAHRVLRNQSLQDYYLLLVKHQKDYVLRVDYHAVVDHHRTEMLPVMQGVIADAPVGSDLRTHIENALNFVQSIPYDTLERRDLNGLSGFLLPPSMIVQNRGDCDTKSAALLAMLSHIMPESPNSYPLIMVLIDGHAFIGANIKPKGSDMVYQYKGSNYVMMEVAGPGLFPVGQLALQSEQALKNNRIIEVIPIKATL